MSGSHVRQTAGEATFCWQSARGHLTGRTGPQREPISLYRPVLISHRKTVIIRPPHQPGLTPSSPWHFPSWNYHSTNTHTHTHTRLTALFPGLPRWASTRKVKPIWILLKQETVSGSGIRWAICKSAPRSRQTTTPAPHRSVFYRPDALPVTQPTASKHWRQILKNHYFQPIILY